MPVVIVEVEGIPEIQFMIEQIKDGIEHAIEGMEYVAESILLPDVRNRSTTTWGIRTGRYSAGWNTRRDSTGVEVYNEVPYAWPLETGWTARDGTIMESPGVLFPAFTDNIPTMVEVFYNWMMQKMGLI